MTPQELAARAEALAGAPFRLGGRDPATGIDCVGLLACALGRRDLAPSGYGLRNTSIAHLLPLLSEAGFVSLDTDEHETSGDVLLLHPGPAQHHIAIRLSAGRCVHAHAGLGRSVIQPAPLPWPLVGRWRLAQN